VVVRHWASRHGAVIMMNDEYDQDDGDDDDDEYDHDVNENMTMVMSMMTSYMKR